MTPFLIKRKKIEDTIFELNGLLDLVYEYADEEVPKFIPVIFNPFMEYEMASTIDSEDLEQIQ